MLSHTGTILSHCVKAYTGDTYSHVSISLDKSLEHMYSFGRTNPYNPFWGSFVQESPNYGTFKRFKNTKVSLYSLDVTDTEYNNIKKVIKDFEKNKEDYRFNTIGLFAVMLHVNVKRKNHYYCAEFVKYVLDNSNVKTDLPDLVKPEDFKNIKGIECIYTGQLRDYKA